MNQAGTGGISTTVEPISVLAPGGVLLCIVPSVSRLSRSAQGREYWRFTEAACLQLFGRVFGPEQVSVAGFGNVLTATAFLMGLSAEELTEAVLDQRNPIFSGVVTVRAAKPAPLWPGK